MRFQSRCRLLDNLREGGLVHRLLFRITHGMAIFDAVALWDSDEPVSKAAITMVGSSGESMQTGDLAKGCLGHHRSQPHRNSKGQKSLMPRIGLCDAGCRNTSADNRPYPGDAAHRY
jgi:hypothetical protein